MKDKQSEDSSGLKSKLAGLIESVRKALKVMAASPRAVKMIWSAHPGYAAGVVILTLIAGLFPLLQLWIGKLIIDTVTESLMKVPGFDLKSLLSAAGLAKLVPLLVVMSIVELTSSILSSICRFLEGQLGDLLNRSINKQILEKANSLKDIAFFESPGFYDSLQLAQDAGYRPMQIMKGLVGILKSSIHFLAVSISFLVLQPLVCIFVLIFSAPSLFLQFKHSRESWAMNIWETPEVRRMYYYRHVLTDKNAASELRMFGLGDFFLGRYLRTFDEFYKKHKQIRWKQCQQNILSNSLAGLSDAGAYSMLAIRTITGSLSIGSFYFYSNALSQMQAQLGNLLWSVSSLYEDNLFLNNLYEYLEMKPGLPEQDPLFTLKTPVPIKQGIEFRNVSFRYPGSQKDVLSGLSFFLEAGRTIALVGENGAGKTTIVKLLGRLYDPDAGEILIDGINLKDLDIDNWRSYCSVIFQDFASYHMSAGDNIGVGQVNFIEDEIRIQSAAERGGAAAVIEKLPKKYETLLGNWFGEKEEASDLSGGQWQKVALARAFMRAPDAEINNLDSAVEKHLKNGSAQLMVLDEPTASLDVQSEHDIYTRFQELTRGKTTVLISHRFSTVKMANLILLLEDGKIRESGSHEELMAQGGEYSRLFKLQADRYL